MISKSTIQGSRILIVEDSPTQAMGLRHLLENDGYIVEVARNGMDAFSRVTVETPSLIISDVVMPEMDGYEFCKRIKSDEKFKSIPIILLTTLSSATDVIKGLECGADNFVTKPYDDNILLTRVTSNLINKEIRKNLKSDVGIEIYFGGSQYQISADRMQILDLLLSTYETAYLKSMNLEKAHTELQELNARLEQKVTERTEHLNQINNLLRTTRKLNRLAGNVDKQEELFRLSCELLTTNGYFSYAAILLTDPAGKPLQVVEDCQEDDRPIFFKQITPDETPQCIRQCVNHQGMMEAGWNEGCGTCTIEAACKEKRLLMGRICQGEDIIGVVALSPTDSLMLGSNDYGVFEEIVSEIAARITTLAQDMRLRDSEQTMRTITNSAQDAIILLDNRMRVSYWNPAAEKMFGYTAEEAIGKKLHETIVPERSREKARKGLDAFRHTGKGPLIGTTVEVSALRRDGTEFPIEVSVSAVALGGQWQAVGIVRDIEERKKIEAQTALTQKLQSIGELSAGIAHEINTPTQYISSNISFLERSFGVLKSMIDTIKSLMCDGSNGGGDSKACATFEQLVADNDLHFLFDEIPPALGGCNDGVKRISDIVESMRYFAHPGKGKKTTFDLNKAIHNAINISRNEWKYYAEVQTSLQEDLPHINCFAAQMNQVLLNIIVNAAQAISSVTGDTPKQKGEISIESRQLDDLVEIRISDTGPGIPEEIRQKIFDHFFTTKEIGKGTGQGLALAHTVVVDNHGGNICVDTAPGEGTTFIIQLPLSLEG